MSHQKATESLHFTPNLSHNLEEVTAGETWIHQHMDELMRKGKMGYVSKWHPSAHRAARRLVPQTWVMCSRGVRAPSGWVWGRSREVQPRSCHITMALQNMCHPPLLEFGKRFMYEWWDVGPFSYGEFKRHNLLPPSTSSSDGWARWVWEDAKGLFKKRRWAIILYGR